MKKLLIILLTVSSLQLCFGQDVKIVNYQSDCDNGLEMPSATHVLSNKSLITLTELVEKTKVGAKEYSPKGEKSLLMTLANNSMKLEKVIHIKSDNYTTGALINSNELDEVVIVGTFSGTNITVNDKKYGVVDPTEGIHTFLITFDKELNVSYVELIESNGRMTEPIAVEITNDGNVFLGLKYSQGGITTGKSHIESHTTDEFDYEHILISYNKQGKQVFYQSFFNPKGDNRNIYMTDIEIDGNDLYVLGNFKGEVQLDNSTIGKWNANSVFLSVYNRIGVRKNSTIISNAEAFDIEISKGKVYLLGKPSVQGEDIISYHPNFNNEGKDLYGTSQVTANHNDVASVFYLNEKMSLIGCSYTDIKLTRPSLIHPGVDFLVTASKTYIALDKKLNVYTHTGRLENSWFLPSTVSPTLNQVQNKVILSGYYHGEYGIKIGDKSELVCKELQYPLYKITLSDNKYWESAGAYLTEDQQTSIGDYWTESIKAGLDYFVIRLKLVNVDCYEGHECTFTFTDGVNQYEMFWNLADWYTRDDQELIGGYAIDYPEEMDCYFSFMDKYGKSSYKDCIGKIFDVKLNGIIIESPDDLKPCSSSEDMITTGCAYIHCMVLVD